MYDDQFDPSDDEALQVADFDQEIDVDEGLVDVRDEADIDGAVEDDLWDDEDRRIENAELDNVTDEFVDLVNGRDLDGLSDLLAEEVEAEFLGATSRGEALEGLGDLFLRYPTLLVTRADLGSEPIVALWTFDHQADRFDKFGFLFFELADDADGQVVRIIYAEDLPDDDEAVIEIPDRGDLPEWEEWSEGDEV